MLPGTDDVPDLVAEVWSRALGEANAADSGRSDLNFSPGRSFGSDSLNRHVVQSSLRQTPRGTGALSMDSEQVLGLNIKNRKESLLPVADGKKPRRNKNSDFIICQTLRRRGAACDNPRTALSTVPAASQGLDARVRGLSSSSETYKLGTFSSSFYR